MEVKDLVQGMHFIGWLLEETDDQAIVQKAALAGIKTPTVSPHSLTR